MPDRYRDNAIKINLVNYYVAQNTADGCKVLLTKRISGDDTPMQTLEEPFSSGQFIAYILA